MAPLKKIFLPLLATAAAATSLAACGGIPGNAVATVDGTAITNASFQHWLAVANSSSASQGAAAQPVPVPPDYTVCVANLAKTTPVTKGVKPPTTKALKAECAQQYNQLMTQVMQFLISADWLEGEAHIQGISVSTSSVMTQFNQLKAQQFPQASAYQTFLKTSGMTEADLLYRVRLNSLSTKIQTKVTKAKPVTAAQISAYYSQNQAKFGAPEKRNLRIILVGSLALATKLQGQLAHGASFSKLAKQYSTDSTTKSSGGADVGVVPGQLVAALNTAVFAASKDKLYGPIKTPFGYYLFRVQKITKGNQKSLASVTSTIRQQLQQQAEQSALTSFVTAFNKKWKGLTKCRAAYAVADCSNAPKTAATGAAATGAAAG